MSFITDMINENRMEKDGFIAEDVPEKDFLQYKATFDGMISEGTVFYVRKNGKGKVCEMTTYRFEGEDALGHMNRKFSGKFVYIRDIIIKKAIDPNERYYVLEIRCHVEDQ